MPITQSRRVIAVVGSCVVLGACASSATKVDLPTGNAAYQAIAPESIPAPTEYIITQSDVFKLQVFGEPDISNDSLRVDQAGNVQVALIGSVKAAGRTPTEVSKEIADRLGKTYIIDPKVNLALLEPAKRFVTVEGEVNKPGVFDLENSFTLLSALAAAGSPTPSAKLDQVIVFRTINGQRMAGRFNLRDIRGGAAPDPTIMSNDVVMVGYSNARGMWQDVLKAAPLLNAFSLIATR